MHLCSASQQWAETGVEDHNQNSGRKSQLEDSLLPAMKARTATKEYLDQYSDQFLKAFESRLFRLFGLKSRPKPKKHYKIPDYMIQLYQQQQQLNQQTSDNYFDDTYQPEEEVTTDVTTDKHAKRWLTKAEQGGKQGKQENHYNQRFSLSGNANTIISYKQHYEGMPPTHLSLTYTVLTYAVLMHCFQCLTKSSFLASLCL